MLIYAGIDEAGYGPMLGPLCVAASAFRLHDHDPQSGAPDLWRLLHPVIGKAGSKKAIAIDDSKKLKGAKSGKAHPLLKLERGVLAFSGLHAALPEHDSAWFQSIGASVPAHGWCSGDSCSLPVACAKDGLGIDSARIDRAMRTANIEFLGSVCEVVHADRFNRDVAKTGNKAVINFNAMVRLVDRLWCKHGAAHPRIVIDRHGGRSHYLEPLRMSFPEAVIRIVAETDRLSRYHLADARGEVTLTFTAEADAAHLPTALASMTAKYTRELFMARLNRYFAAYAPEVKPTAGYTQDARRYLKELAGTIRELGIDQRDLIRSL